ncbi:putative ribonuclease H-like domain-containing protein [Tanacetum coccineum]
MDLKWQVAMISMRMKKFYKKTGRKLQFDAKEPVGFDKTKVECYNCHKTGHFARECRIKGNQDNRRRDAWNSGTKDGSRTGKKEDSKALVTIDGEGVDWTNHSEEDEDYALMACNSSDSDTEVTSCSNKCKESYANLKKLYDAQREQLSDASIEIKAYSQGLKKVEAQLVAHQQGQLWETAVKTIPDVVIGDHKDTLGTLSPIQWIIHIELLKNKDYVIQEAGDNQKAVQKDMIDAGDVLKTSYVQKQRRNNHKDFQHCLFACFLSQHEPKKISEALEDESWVDVMQEELLQFEIHKVWILVDLPFGKKAIGIKWVYRNKKDERGVVVRNKARLVAQGHRQEEGIDYDDEGFLLHLWPDEAIRIFLSFASYMGFIVYQMDVKSAFLYGKINEEVYVSQPPGFLDPKYPQKVYKVVKALYGLHQAPRAWYATLSTFLLKNGYKRGTIDKTLFIKKDKNDIILVQVYVDDIIFGSTKKSWCDEFEALMKSRFQMSSMGELTFFLGLQVKQKPDGIFISQDKYVAEILKKFDFANVKTASTPIETQKPLVKDEEASNVVVHLYRSRIGSLMYLTASRPDIMFAVCACSRFQVTPKSSHLSAVKRIFRYLKGKPKLGLWYPRVSLFDLESYSDSDYAGANLDKKSTIGGCQFLGRRLISWQCKKQTIVATSTTEAEYVVAVSCCGQVLWIQNQMFQFLVVSIEKKFVMYPRFVSIFLDNQLANVPVPLDYFPINALTSKGMRDEMTLQSGLDLCLLMGMILKEQWVHKSIVIQTGEESLLKVKTFSPKEYPLFDEIPEDTLDHMETENAQDVGRTRDIVGEEKENDENILSTEDVLSTDKEKVSTDKEKVSTDTTNAEKKFKQLESDEEMARKIQEEWEGEEERNRIAKEKATNEALIRNYDDINARIEADRLLAEKLQEEEREQFTIEERAKNRPPTKNQLRNQMMAYLKHVGNFKHSELKTKKFEEIQALYEKIKRSDEDFISIRSAEDERLIKKMNEKGIDSSKNEMVKEESKEEVKEDNKEEESTRKRKLGTRKKIKSRKRRFIHNTSEDDSEKENDELRLHLTIAPDEEKEVDYEILDRKYPIKEWKTECLGTKPQVDKAKHLEEINQNVVIRSNGQKRYFSTLMRVLSIFDREDLNAVCEDEFWNSQQDWNIVSWKLHGSSGVHTLVTEAGLVIHMLVEKKYPLRKKVLLQMLKLKLESEEDSTMALELIDLVKSYLQMLETCKDSDGDDRIF